MHSTIFHNDKESLERLMYWTVGNCGKYMMRKLLAKVRTWPKNSNAKHPVQNMYLKLVQLILDVLIKQSEIIIRQELG